MRRLASYPYKDVLDERGGTPLNSGADVVNVKTRLKHLPPEFHDKVKQATTIIHTMLGKDQGGTWSDSTRPWLEKSGDGDSVTLPSTQWQMFPGTKNEGGLQNDLFNRPKEIREYLSKGGNHNQPFPYTASSRLQQVFSAIELPKPPQAEKPKEEFTRVATPMDKLIQSWNIVLQNSNKDIQYEHLAHLFRLLTWDLAKAKTSKTVPERELVASTSTWLHSKTSLSQVLRFGGSKFHPDQTFEDLILGLGNIYYRLRDLNTTGRVITPPNHNQGYYY